MSLASIRKALAASVAAALAAAVTAYPDGFTSLEVSAIVGAAIVAGVAVFQIPNRPPTN
jgi:hypothetical protein